jgi:hypothetical protein
VEPEETADPVDYHGGKYNGFEVYKKTLQLETIEAEQAVVQSTVFGGEEWANKRKLIISHYFGIVSLIDQ